MGKVAHEKADFSPQRNCQKLNKSKENWTENAQDQVRCEPSTSEAYNPSVHGGWQPETTNSTNKKEINML